MVYDYALYYEDGLVTVPSPSSALFTINGDGPTTNQDPNNFRYACREVYEETRGIVFKNNTVTFRGEPHQCGRDYNALHVIDDALGQFVKVVKEPGQAIPHGLKKIVIQFEDCLVLDPLTTLINDNGFLSKFCRMHPDVTVIARFQLIDAPFPLAEHFAALITYHYYFRRTHIEIPNFDTGDWYTQSLFERAQYWHSTYHIPKNLRISFLEGGKFGLDALVHNIGNLEGWIPAQIQDLIALAKRMFDEGI
jgi:hypothetical protein